MKNLLFLLALCIGTPVYAGRIGWEMIRVKHFETIFDTIKIGDTISAELIGLTEGEYQLKNHYFIDIQGPHYFFFIPHPGPGHPVQVITRDTVYGKQPVSQDWGNDSKELTEYRAGSLYDNLNIGKYIAIDGIHYLVTGQYPRTDTLRIFKLVSNDNKQKSLMLEQTKDVGNIFISCEDIQKECLIG